MLYTNLEIGTNFYSGTVYNFKKIVKDFSIIDQKINKHIKQNNISHNAKQISYKNTTVENTLNYQSERIEHLVTGVDGDGVKEVTDSRISTNGKKHGLLSDRLQYDFNSIDKKIKETNDKFIEIDFDTYNPDKTGENGANDDLQRALNDIKEADGGTLIIKDGIYLINKRLSVPGNTTIIMHNNAVILRGNTGVLFDYGDNSEVYCDYSGPSNIHMVGGTLDNNLEQIDKYPVNAANMINIRHADNISFKNVKFKNNITYHVMDINGVSNLRIIDCIFEGHKNLLPDTAVEKEAIQISEVMRGGVGGPGAWDGTPCKNVVISGCVFCPSELAGGFDVAIGNHASIHNVYQRNIKITNNVFEDCNVGVKPFKWSNVEISGNTFDNNNDCIKVRSVKGNSNSAKYIDGKPSKTSQAGDMYTIKDNLFRYFNNKAVGIYGEEHNESIAYVGNVRILNNTFYCKNNDKGENIVIDLCRHIHIKGNNISYSYRGMNLSASHNIFINENYMSNLKREGIFINQSDSNYFAKKINHLNISNNIINTTGRNGLYVQNASFVYITNNKILNPNEAEGDEIGRGGLYIHDCKNGRIEGNDFWGEKKAFAIKGTVLSNFIAFNNGGSGKVNMYGDSTYIGYYNVSNGDNIFKTETKGVE